MRRYVITVGILMFSLCANVFADQSSTVLPGPILPIPSHPPEISKSKAELGARLFVDPQLSRSGDLTCVSCHMFSRGGSDPAVRSRGLAGALTARNSLSVFNLAYKTTYGWDGRFSGLSEQARVVLDVEMGIDWDETIESLNSDGEYRSLFYAAYDGKATPERITDALAAYQLTLVTPDSRFDQYLRGDKQAITEAELRGYTLFKRYGCIACHQGVLVGGNMLARIGIFENYFSDENKAMPADLGHFNVSRREQDRYRFIVPSLRNVALTAPYLHDGSEDTLLDVIKLMGRYQLGRDVPGGDARRIEDFLKTLTGQFQGTPLW